MDIKDVNSRTTLNNGTEMPVLGLGTYKADDGQEVKKAIKYAFDAGYRLIDTAAFYENEEGVGEAIRNSGLSREEIFVTTKVWNDDHGYQNTLDAFEVSRKKLGLDYVDLYLIHWPVPGKYTETWKALEKLYKDGKVKAIGISNFLEHHIEELLKQAEVVPAVIQNEFHPRLVQQSLVDFCREKGIQYQAYSPLMRGELLDNDLMRELAEKHDKTVAQIIIRWDLQKGISTIPKSVHKERIEENADVFDFELSRKEMEQIDSLDRNERKGAHPDDFMEHFRKK